MPESPQQSFAAAVAAKAGTTASEAVVAAILVELDVACPDTISDADVDAAAATLREALTPAMPKNSPGMPPRARHDLLPAAERIRTPGSEAERVAEIARRYSRGGR